MKKLVLIACLAAAAISHAVVIEGFEHGNAGLYTEYHDGGLSDLSINSGAAHDGSFGASFASYDSNWFYRTDVATSPGNIYSAFVRFTESSEGRSYIGIGASAAGAWSMVAANNTNTIVLQRNTNYGFTSIMSASFTFAINTWYQIELDWGLTGNMQVSLWDETRSNLLAQTGTHASGFTSAGGLAIRGFDGSQIDTISASAPGVVPEPFTMTLLGAAALAGYRRIRKQAA